MTNTNAPAAAPAFDAESAKERFFDSGIQYYLTARYAAFAHLSPVCGNLFHHAVEMFIKGGLAHLGLGALKRLGHQFPRKWEALKDCDASLDRFDGVIVALDRFDLIRYPDRVLAEPDARTLRLAGSVNDFAAKRLLMCQVLQSAFYSWRQIFVLQ